MIKAIVQNNKENEDIVFNQDIITMGDSCYFFKGIYVLKYIIIIIVI